MNNKHLKQKMNVNPMSCSPQSHQNIKKKVYTLYHLDWKRTFFFHNWLFKKFVYPLSFFSKSWLLMKEVKIPGTSKYFLNWNLSGRITPLIFFSSIVLMLFKRTVSKVLSRVIILGFSYWSLLCRDFKNLYSVSISSNWFLQN